MEKELNKTYVLYAILLALLLMMPVFALAESYSGEANLVFSTETQEGGAAQNGAGFEKGLTDYQKTLTAILFVLFVVLVVYLIASFLKSRKQKARAGKSRKKKQ